MRRIIKPRPCYNLPSGSILNGDSISMLQTLPDASIDCVVTSPPYYGLRDYSIDGQIGMENTPKEYVNALLSVFNEVHRVLSATGTVWLNLGDSYYNYRPGRGQSLSKQTLSSNLQDLPQKCPRRGNKLEGLKEKDLIGIPWRVAFALQDFGWYLRQDIIWEKTNPQPESVKDRCTKSHEYLFLLTKSPKYYYDHAAIKEPCSEANIKDFLGRKTLNNKGKGQGTYEEARPDLCRGREAYMPPDFKRNKRSVWTIPTKPYKGAHFATFPEALVEPCIMAGCPVDGVVLDPFFGAGTTGVVATKLNRRFVGIDLNKDYCDLAYRRIQSLCK